MTAIIPIPKIQTAIRVATMEDFAAIDAIQKQHHKQLGFFPRAQMEGYIKSGWVIVAEHEAGQIVGYCASRDRYLKRDELGAIFQLCVAPGSQRKFVGMALLKHVFDQAPYGCKLYCCWCAQDIEANRFWEAMGFVPLAFRAGSAKKSRVHIFWQRRIREGDVMTPHWFPSQTGGGSIREDRLVLPIPPGTHWRDVMPMVLPGRDLPGTRGELPDQKIKRGRNAAKLPPVLQAPTRQRVQFGRPSTRPLPPPVEKKAKVKKQKAKNDPKLVAAARELRDRWLEKVNSGQSLPEASGKYDVTRQLSVAPPKELPQLPQAIAA